MKRLAALASTVSYFFFTTAIHAQALSPIQIRPPRTATGQVGYSDFGTFLNAALRLVFIIALVAVLAMLVWGAVQWIFSGGEKEAVAAARGRIINALIGLAILAVAFAIVQVAGQFLGFNLLGQFIIPSPSNSEPLLPQ